MYSWRISSRQKKPEASTTTVKLPLLPFGSGGVGLLTLYHSWPREHTACPTMVTLQLHPRLQARRLAFVLRKETRQFLLMLTINHKMSSKGGNGMILDSLRTLYYSLILKDMPDTRLILHVKGTEAETTELSRDVVRAAVSQGQLTHSQLIWSPQHK